MTKVFDANTGPRAEFISKSSARRKQTASETDDTDELAMSLKGFRRKSSSGLFGSGGSNGSGNNSDNSAISLGNNSFGFNFDSEEGNMGDSPPNSGDDAKSDNSETQREQTQSGKRSENKKESTAAPIKSSPPEIAGTGLSDSAAPSSQVNVSAPAESQTSHEQAAAAAVANLQSIANVISSKATQQSGQEGSELKTVEEEKESSGYNSDDESAYSVKTKPAKKETAKQNPEIPDSPISNSGNASHSVPSSSSTITHSNPDSDDDNGPPKKKSRKIDDSKREERNAREKERSFRISKQINELRTLLSCGGVIVPKGTKSSVLTEAANYIRMLQQHQYRSEIDRHQLIQQMQMIGGGALGPQAAGAVRHVAAQNGVWSLGNFGGVPPKSAMSAFQQGAATAAPAPQAQQGSAPLSTTLEEHEYRFVFNSCAVGMAIASMGGAFIDCNHLFTQLSQFSKQEICAMTIFNLTSRQDLQHAFDLISQMISPPVEGQNEQARPCVLRGTMKNRNDLGLSVSLVKGDDGIAKCFCVTLIKNPSSPSDTSKPVPATSDMIIANPTQQASKMETMSTPAYTTG